MTFIHKMRVFPTSIYPQSAKPGEKTDGPAKPAGDVFTPQSAPVNSVAVWRSYIQFLLRLKTAAPEEFNRIPAVLKHFSSGDIQSLKASDVEALKAMNALPDTDPETIDTERILASQSYIRTLRKLKDEPKEYSNVPAILKTLSENEIERLTPEQTEALRLLGALPETLFVYANPASMADLDEALEQLVKTNPELKKIANMNDAMQFAKHPAVIALLRSRPELRHLLDQETEKRMKPSCPYPPDGANHLNLIEKFLKGNLDWLFGGF